MCIKKQSSFKVKKLNWVILEGQFGNHWLASIQGIDARYCIWVERDTGKTKMASIDRKNHYFNNIDEAKEWCQKHYENLVLNLLEYD